MNVDVRKAPPSVTPVILCGGGGTRLWPLSRKDFPKQFVADEGALSLYQQTLLRLKKTFQSAPIVVTGKKYKFLAAQQAARVKVEATLICEPEGRNSGPAALAAAIYALEHAGPDVKIGVYASDHVIKEEEKFIEASQIAVRAADAGKIVTFGIAPQNPSEAYGYIKPGAAIESGAFVTDKFVEKPDRLTAQKYIADGYLWNSGNFMFKAETLLEEYTKYDPETVRIVRVALGEAATDLQALELSSRYGGAKDLSIDYAVMEKTDKAAVVRADYYWSDAGTWPVLHDIAEKDAKGNAFSGLVSALDVENCYVKNGSAGVTALIGLSDTIVVNTGDAVFVAPKAQADRVKDLLAEMKSEGVSQAETGAVTYRPWGNYRSVDTGERYQVKRITVNPGGKLSLQKHFHRSEHWVIVSGSALVTVGDKTELLTENRSVYIPAGAVHRLENPGKLPLELIEVQSGPYLGEDDIVRLEDIYNRS